MKICAKCKQEKSLEEFFNLKKSKDGKDYCCKRCNHLSSNESKKKWRDNNKEKIKKNNLNYQINNQEKIKEYRKNYYDENKEKILIYLKLFSLENKEKISEWNKNWNLNNKDFIQEYNKIWRNNNKQKIKEYNSKPEIIQKNNKRANYRYHNDEIFKITMILRTRFYQAIKEGIKYVSVLNLLGCSIEEARLHLENKFTPEMSWSNHGSVWEIDHILPCSSFDLTKEEEQRKCFHYSNLQPLFKTTEIAKSFGYKNHTGNRDKFNK